MTRTPRVLDWVRALAGGGRRVAGRPPGSDMVVLLRPATLGRTVVERGGGVVVQRHAHEHHHLARWQRVTVGAEPSAPGAPAWARDGAEGVSGAAGTNGAAGASGAVLTLTGPPVAARAGRAVAERVVTTHRRVEGAAAPARAVPIAAVAEPRRSASPTPAASPPAPPVPTPPQHAAPMVLRASAPATRTADRNAPTTEPPPGAPRGRTRDLHAAPADAGTPTSLLDDPAQLATLTDRIVAQIDRRMTAHRERLGQL